MTTKVKPITKAKLTVNISADVLKTLDKNRGDTPRSLFVQRALERYFTLVSGGIRRAKK